MDYHSTVPEGYTTVAELADAYGISRECARDRLYRSGVQPIHLKRRNSSGVSLGGHELLAYPTEQARLAMKTRRPRGARHRYLRKIAAAYGLPPERVHALLEEVGVPHELRTCPTCGKKTHYYPDTKTTARALQAYRAPRGEI